MVQQNSMPDIWWGSRECSSQVHSLENAEDVHEYVIHAKHMMDVREQISNIFKRLLAKTLVLLFILVFDSNKKSDTQ